jgi:predicted aspartyl protease
MLKSSILHIGFTVVVTSLVLAACTSIGVVPLSRDTKSGYFIAESIIDGEPANLVVDTGTTMPAISSDYARAHRIVFSADQMLENEHDSASSGRSVASLQPPLGFATLESFSVGNIKFSGAVQFQVYDLSALNSRTEENISGILGTGALNSRPYRIDFQRLQLTIGDKLNRPRLSFPLLLVDNLLYVDIQICGHAKRFLVDTGSLNSWIDADTLQDIECGYRISGSGTYDVLVGNRLNRLAVNRVTLDHIQLSGQQFSGVVFFAGTSNVLGLDILARGSLFLDPIGKDYYLDLSGAEL